MCGTFLEYPSSGTLKIERLESQIIQNSGNNKTKGPKQDNQKSGEEVIASLYGGIIYEGLFNLLRYRKFTRKVMQNPVFLQVNTLSPTSAAASYHSKRAYLQLQEWVVTTDHISPL